MIIRNSFIHIITGPMFSAKTHMLINEYHRYSDFYDDFESISLVVKPKIDTRNSDVVFSRSAGSIPAVMLEKCSDIKDLITDSIKFIFVDEFQFFGAEAVEIIKKLNIEKNITVFASGLDLDFKREEFETYKLIKGIATFQTKTTAICFTCGKTAMYSKISQAGAENNEQIQIENEHVKYYSSCLKCHKN